jgi:hypothetical protein
VKRSRLVIALTLAALCMAAPASAKLHPSLSMSGTRHAVIHGRAFHAREHVKVLIRTNAGSTFTRRVTATAAGTFSTSVDLPSPPCGDFGVSATGSDGSRAILGGMMHADCIVN